MIAIWWPLRSFGIGLGLGNAAVESTLSSPLKVSIPLRGMENVVLDPEKFSIEIEDASRKNMEYRLENIEGDNATIVVYTRQMVTDPVVHFRIRVKSGWSAIARSYDVFIDPPSYKYQSYEQGDTTADSTGVIAPAPPVDEGTGTQYAVETPGRNQTFTRVPEIDAGGLTSEAVSGERTRASTAPVDHIDTDLPRQRDIYGPTIDGNSIWRVARAVSTDNPDLTKYQWMYAIWKANPNGFTGSNMHRLNIGVLLTIPFEQEIAETPHLQAWRAYNEQMKLLQAPSESEAPASSDPAIQADSGSKWMPVSPSRITKDRISAATGQSAIAAVDQPPPSASRQQSDNSMPVATMATIEAADASNDLEEVRVSIGMAVASQTDQQVSTGRRAINEPADEPVAAVVADAGILQSSAAASEMPPVDSTDTVPRQVAAMSQDQPVTATSAVPGVSRTGFLQQVADFFFSVSTWIAMLIGSLLTLVSTFAARQLSSRLGASAAIKAISAPGPLVPAVSQAHADTAPEDKASPAGEPVSASEKGMDVEQKHEDSRAVETDESGSGKDNQSPVKRGMDRRVSDRRTSVPVAPVNHKSDEILDKANSFLASGNSSEAIKLLELTVKLQPDRLNLVLRLLEIYHKMERAEDFERLVLRFKPALEVMEISTQIDLQVMYSSICPESPPIIDPEKALNPDDTDPGLPDSAHDAGAVDIFMDGSMAEHETGADEDTSSEVILFKNGEILDEDPAGLSGDAGGVLYPEVSLQEVDVYLAYGLYESAEELLQKGMQASPGRVDFMARLLDCYYATGNVVDFETEAEALRALGEVADPYWERVQVMGYKLAPYNEMFLQGKGKDLGENEPVMSPPGHPDPEPGECHETDDFPSLDHAVPEDDGDIEIVLDDAEFELDLDEFENNPGELEIQVNADAGKTIGMQADASEVELEELPDEIEAEADVGEFALYEGQSASSDEEAFLLDEEDLADLDLADAFAETNLNLDAAIGAAHAPVSKPGSLDTSQIFKADKVEAAEASDETDAVDDLVDDSATAEDFPEIEFSREDEEGDSLKAETGDESMKFTIPDDSEVETEAVDSGADTGDEQQEAAGTESAEQEPDPLDSRILYFPDTGTDRVRSVQFEEFASEVRMTLQSIRDQLQNVTERQYRQERETHELHKSVLETNTDKADSKRDKKKRSN